MSDIEGNLHIATQDTGEAGFKPVAISQDENQNAVDNPIFSKISDGTNGLSLVIVNSAYGATPTIVPVAGKYEATPTTYTDGDATPFLTDENGRLQVEVSSLSGLPSKDDDSAFSLGVDKVSPVAGIYVSGGDSVDDGDVGALRMTVDRLLYTQPFDGTNSMPMLDVNTRAGFMQITDGSNDLSIDASGYAQVDLAAQSIGSIAISADNNANSELNPLFVEITDSGASSTELIDYSSDTVPKVTPANHDYTITSSKTLKVRSIICSGSSSAKFEIMTGPLATLVTQFVVFITAAANTAQPMLEGRLELTEAAGSETLRIIKTNRDNQTQDLYTTIIGNEV